MIKYIYQNKQWPDFYWNKEKILSLLADVKLAKGILFGQMISIGFDLQEKADLTIITQDIVKTSEIEGELLNPKEVRSSVARKLGITIENSIGSKRNVDGIVDMTINAIYKRNDKLTQERLFGWHNSLFPKGYSGLHKIKVAGFRDDSGGPMQVVSGPIGKEIVHYQAPSAEKLNLEMDRFLDWLNKDDRHDKIIKSAIAHLWFVTLHPFDDGNGRIARAITDMLLAQSDDNNKRFYSLSSQIQQDKNNYYNILEKTQKGNLDITDWLEWFLNCLLSAIQNSEKVLSDIFKKHKFLQKILTQNLQARQINVIKKMFEDFQGKLTTSKYAKLCKCSQDTANRDIDILVENKILLKQGDGRNTHYIINNDL